MYDLSELAGNVIGVSRFNPTGIVHLGPATHCIVIEGSSLALRIGHAGHPIHRVVGVIEDAPRCRHLRPVAVSVVGVDDGRAETARQRLDLLRQAVQAVVVFCDHAAI